MNFGMIGTAMPDSFKLERDKRGRKMRSYEGEIKALIKPLVEELLVEERDRQIEEFEKRGAKIIRWGYTVRKDWQTPWGVLRRVRIPRLRGAREIGLMEEYYPRIAARLQHLDRWQRKCLEYWAAWIFFLRVGCGVLTSRPIRPQFAGRLI